LPLLGLAHHTVLAEGQGHILAPGSFRDLLCRANVTVRLNLSQVRDQHAISRACGNKLTRMVSGLPALFQDNS
jgi:hypothetical protein